MTNKTYTAEQLRVAREIVDQEEAIEAERKRRRERQAAAPKPKIKASVTTKSKTGKVSNTRTKKAIQRSLIGLFVFWIINAGLYPASGETSLYRKVLVWAVPLIWLFLVWLPVLDSGDRDVSQTIIATNRKRKSHKKQNEDTALVLITILVVIFMTGIALYAIGILR